MAFLDAAQKIFDEYGDIPFVHWHHYERVHIDQYIDRYGNSNGIAARVKANLLDLLPVTKNSIALPLPSYSLKVVEGYVGFKRTQE
jgi:predicted RecB family nuclease